MKYTDSHEWIRMDGKKGTVGISSHAQKELGEIVYIELPKVGDEVVAEDEVAVLESTKAAADIYTPVSGTITKINTELAQDVTALNEAPESAGWLFEIEVKDESELRNLLSSAAYSELISNF